MGYSDIHGHVAFSHLIDIPFMQKILSSRIMSTNIALFYVCLCVNKGQLDEIIKLCIVGC